MTERPDFEAIRFVIDEYLKGMIYGEPERLRAIMHPKCMQAGHNRDVYEFFTRDEFIDAIMAESAEPAGTPIRSRIGFIDITGDIAVAKVTDDCFGTTWTDYLTFIKHEGRWRMAMKAFYDHART